MKKTVWAIKKAHYDGKELEKLLYEGWEPFSIIIGFPHDIIWLKKLVKVEVNNGS